MNETEARNFVKDSVTATHEQMMIMKALLLANYQESATAMLETAVSQVGGRKPAEVVVHRSVDLNSTLRQLAEWISWSIAGCEAIWALIHANVLLPTTVEQSTFRPSVRWTTVVPGSGGGRGGWDFPEFTISYPQNVTKSRAVVERGILSDPDLFINELSISVIHPEIEDALRSAVLCFRVELFMPALVMLGKASEGAWIELGLALIAALPEAERVKHEKRKMEWSGPDVGFAKKSRDILKFFESQQETFRSLSSAVRVRLEDVRLALVWSDSVREVRNVIHHGNESAIRASYETATTLLIASMVHLKNLRRLHAAAIELATHN